MDITDRNTAARLAHVLSELTVLDSYNRDSGAAAALVTNGYVVSQAWTSSPTPAWLVWHEGTTLVVALTGLSTFSQGAGLFGAAIEPPVSAGAFGANGYALAAARTVALHLGLWTSRPGANVVVTGHSYGGGLASILAAGILAIFPGAPVQLLTFGSPRVLDQAGAELLDSIPVRRIMNTGDAVPYFPPNWFEAPNAAVTIGLAASVNVASYVQPRGGVLLDLAGQTRARELPPQVLPYADLSLLAWLSQVSRLHSAEHSIQTYDQRIGATVTQVGPPVPTITGTWKGELADPPSQAEFNIIAGGGAPVILEPAMPAVGSTFIPVPYRARARRVGSRYGVLWMDQIVIDCVSRTRARTTAKHLNRFLKNLQTATAIYQGLWADAWVAYLQAASSTPAGFMPLLNVV